MVSMYKLTERRSERTVSDKIACKTHLECKMTVLSTFLESSLNFLSNNLKKYGVKLPDTQYL